MNPTNPIIVIALLLIALLVSKIISASFKITLKPVKYIAIDGLRGYLAFFVFLHHACVYYFFLGSWSWSAPPSRLFVHFGQTSVSLFFMITGFLFFTKLIEARKKPIDWLYFFTSRFLRLYPLYILLLIVFLTVIAVMSGFVLNEPIIQILRELKHWIFFAVRDWPNINKYGETNGIMAGIIWSIRYEWFFYFSLPFIGLIFFKQRPPILILLISILIACYLYFYTTILSIHLFSFISGFIAALLAKTGFFIKIAQHFLFSVLIVICLFITVCFFDTAYDYIPWALTSLAFFFIAGGNTIFGLLSLNVSRQLGQLSYSIYLLHTTFLFIFYRIIIGFEAADKLTAFEFWLVTGGFSVILIALCFVTYYFIELPCINSAKNATLKIKIVKEKVFGVTLFGSKRS